MKLSFKKKKPEPEFSHQYDIKFDDFKELPNGTLIFSIVDDNDPDFAGVVGYGIIPPTTGNPESIVGHFTEFNEDDEEYLLKQLHYFRCSII